MKRFFAILLCLTLLLGLVACGESAPADSTGTEDVQASSSPSGTSSDTGSSDSSDSTAGEENKPQMYDPEAEHLVIAGYVDGTIAILDLNAEGDITDLEQLTDAEIWLWDPQKDKNCRYPDKAGAAGMKYRYSAYWDTDVILLAQSNGWVGIVDYNTRTLLFEDVLPVGPHCAEMMPNGDFVVASSGNGKNDAAGLYYYPLSQGETRHSDFVPFLGAHGVCYDPENECLWALGDYEVRSYIVKDYGTAEATLRWVEGDGASLADLKDIGGHNLTPVYGQPGKYWVTSIKGMWLFDTEEGTLTQSYKYKQNLSYPNIKGMCYFPDGTAVQAGYVGEGGLNGYCSTALRIHMLEMSEGKVSKLVVNTIEIPFGKDKQVYKIQPFIKDYQ